MTIKEQIWLTEYIKCRFNATEAARRAGYKWPEKQGLQIKQRLDKEIKAYLSEYILSPEETLLLLSEHATASHADFVDVNIRDDLREHPKAHLIKSVIADVYEDKLGKIHHKLKLELHDAQSALSLIGRYHGLFTDKIELKLEKEVESFFVKLEQSLDADTFQRVLQALSAGRDNPEISGATLTEDTE